MKKTSLHDGHRDRLREKFIRHGLSSLEPHEVVELMLYAAVPRKDMNPLAHEFGRLWLLSGLIGCSDRRVNEI